MTILIDGTSLINKGAEMMALAVIQEIEKNYPDATVLYQDWFYLAKKNYFNTNLNIKYVNKKNLFYFLVKRFHIQGIFNKLHIPCTLIKMRNFFSGVDVLLDAGGFQFGDNWNLSLKDVKERYEYYRKYYEAGTKIIFLPQSFGEMQSESSQIIIKVLNNFASKVYPRDIESYENLKNGGIKQSMEVFPDFTALVDQQSNNQFTIKENTVAIIPNHKMTDMTSLDEEGYISFIVQLINYLRVNKFNPILVNHEGVRDKKICELIGTIVPGTLVYGDLSVVELKQLLSLCYGVISSRFHGVANSLNSGTPCISTSWNVKYENLFKDYQLTDMVISKCEINSDTKRVLQHILDIKENEFLRKKLIESKKNICDKNRLMWNEIHRVIKNDNN